MKNEIWKDVVGYEGLYKVSNMGRVKHIDGRMYPIKTYPYVIVGLKKDGKTTNCSIHRIVMTAFVPNPENKRVVNHKNFDRSDCRLENLEWCTDTENFNHYHANKHNISPEIAEKIKREPRAIGISCEMRDFNLIAKAAEADNRPIATFVRLAAIEKAKQKKQ